MGTSRSPPISLSRGLVPSDFQQTSNALSGDRARGRRSVVALGAAGGLLALAAAWSALARVPLHAVSQRARLEARGGIHPVDAMVTGRVTAVGMPLGARVVRGEVLLTLDSTDVRLRLDEARAAERGLSGQDAALEAELAAREEALASEESLGRASLSEARALRDQSRAGAELARRERARADVLRQRGLVAEAEADRARAAMSQARAADDARGHHVSRLDSEARRDAADRRAETERLRRALAELRARRDQARAQVERLEVELERHTVRAPVAGLLGRVDAPRVGSVVAAGQTVAVVVPEAEVEVAADLDAADAIGRVRPGQRARMRVTGFPWTRHGALEATVRAVASEPTDGRVRVLLRLDEGAAPTIPRRHGLVGQVEIELGEVSPAALLLRSLGRLVEGAP